MLVKEKLNWSWCFTGSSIWDSRFQLGIHPIKEEKGWFVETNCASHEWRQFSSNRTWNVVVKSPWSQVIFVKRHRFCVF